MILNSSFSIIKVLHTFISLNFLVIAVWIFLRSYKGFFFKKPYFRFDKLLSFGFVIYLYLQLIFGLFLFSNLGSSIGSNYLNADKIVSKRLWPIEHIVLMLFALLIANLGLIITINTKSDRSKHLNTLIYYSISLILIIISLFANYFL